MTKLANLAPIVPAIKAKGRIKTRSVTAPDTLTYEGGAGYTRKTKSELFLLAVANMVGEDSFYEKGADRDKRFRELVAKVTKNDPDWVARFVPYLRSELNMRSASVVAAIEYVRAGGQNGRRVVDSALQRPDEPSEALGYYRSLYSRSVPQPIKRGVADAARRMFNERAVIKWDGENRGYRLADVIELAHPEPKADWQSRLFKYVLDKRHNRTGEEDYELIPRIAGYHKLMAVPVSERRAMLDREDFTEVLEDAGMTWEALSGWLQGPMDAKAWERIIPVMGYMALLRNLRNFEQAGISKEVMASVYTKLSDPAEVARSKQLPIRFYSAFKNVQGFGTKNALEEALQGTLPNVPSLSGKTLILVDMSGSMDAPLSGALSTTKRMEAAMLFGGALALRAESADLYRYGTGHQQIKWQGGVPLLQLMRDSLTSMGGTETFQTLVQTFNNHDRVIILTDEQAFAWGQTGSAGYRNFYGYQRPHANVEKAVEAITVPIYTFNLAGYQQGHLPSGENGRYTFGGLTDAGFKLIDLLERGQKEAWPF